MGLWDCVISLLVAGNSSLYHLASSLSIADPLSTNFCRLAEGSACPLLVGLLLEQAEVVCFRFGLINLIGLTGVVVLSVLLQGAWLLVLNFRSFLGLKEPRVIKRLAFAPNCHPRVVPWPNWGSIKHPYF